MWTYMMAAARGDRAMSMINARRNGPRSSELESPSRLSRPLFSGHRIPRHGNGPSNLNNPFGSSQVYHSYASTSYPLPQYTTSNPNRCPHNSNDIFGQYSSTGNHVDLSRNPSEIANSIGMKDERFSETVIEDGHMSEIEASEHASSSTSKNRAARSSSSDLKNVLSSEQRAARTMFCLANCFSPK